MSVPLISVLCLAGAGGLAFAIATLSRKLAEEELLKVTALTTASRLLEGGTIYLDDLEAAYHDEAKKAIGTDNAMLTAAEAHRVAIWLRHFFDRFGVDVPGVEMRLENLERSLPTYLVGTVTGSFYPFVIAMLGVLVTLGLRFVHHSHEPSNWWPAGFSLGVLGFTIGAVVRARHFICLRKVRRSAEANMRAAIDRDT